MTRENYNRAADGVYSRFRSDEAVLQSMPLLEGRPVQRFGQTDVWDLNAWERNPNVAPSGHRIYFKAPNERWNLRMREIAMAMFNPGHPQVRACGIFQAMAPAAVSTVRSVVGCLRTLAEWAIKQGIGEDPRGWHEDDFNRFLKDSGVSGKGKYYRAIRYLHRYHPLLTYAGLSKEPWPGSSIESLLGSPSKSKKVKTEAIPPEVWWPLLRAAWQYIDVFSADILKARSRWEQLTQADPIEHEGNLSPQELVASWLDDPANFIPLHPQGNARKSAHGSDESLVNWSLLSLLVTNGRTRGLFSGGRKAPAALKSAVMDHKHRAQVFDLMPDACPVETAVEGTVPWIKGVTPQRLWHEAVALRTACYIFVAALSMLRDSELQGILRDSVVQHYGAPAIRSRKFKQDPSRAEQHWWIITPVAQALAVAEALSNHPTRVFGPVRRTVENGGIWAIKDLRKFVKHVNAHHAEFGIEEIPHKRLAPHMFRKTMSIITAQQPDGEIALGLTLKHAAIRALSNATTTGYAEPTPEWAEELRISLSDATAVRLAHLMRARKSGETVATGPGAEAFHAMLDRVEAAVNGAVDFAGNVIDDRTLRNALRSEFASIKFGNLNACLGDLGAALCLTPGGASGNQQLVINPARCQPSLCRNSVVTREHRPLWIATEQDILKALKDRGVSKTNRAVLRQELAEIRKVIGSADETQEEADDE